MKTLLGKSIRTTLSLVQLRSCCWYSCRRRCWWKWVERKYQVDGRFMFRNRLLLPLCWCGSGCLPQRRSHKFHSFRPGDRLGNFGGRVSINTRSRTGDEGVRPNGARLPRPSLNLCPQCRAERERRRDHFSTHRRSRLFFSAEELLVLVHHFIIVASLILAGRKEAPRQSR